MPNKASVSVIIPVYNGERFLREAIQSVLDQICQPLELIVVDDGSTDQSAQIAKSFGPPVCLLSQTNQGPGEARNAGIRKASGEFLAFLDADDIWLPHKLSAQIEYLKNHREASSVVSRIKFFLEKGHTLPKTIPPERLEETPVAYLLQTLVARRPVFDAVGCFNPEFGSADDADWFARAKDKGMAPAVVDEVLVLKRIHSSNISDQFTQNTRNLLKILRQSVERQRKKNI